MVTQRTVNAMDLSRIGTEAIVFFSTCYNHARYFFDTEPVSVGPSMQRKIRKWIQKQHFRDREAQDHLVAAKIYVDAAASDETFFAFLHTCFEDVKRNGDAEKRRIDTLCPELPEAVRQTLWELINGEPWELSISTRDCDYILTITSAPPCIQKLVLLDASGIPESGADALYFEDGTLTKRDGRYFLTGQAEKYGQTTSTDFTLSFTGIRLEITPFRSEMQFYAEKPWNCLLSLSGVLLQKRDIPGCQLSPTEEALLPLAQEIYSLFRSNWRVTERCCDSFPQFKTLISQYGFAELLPQVTSLEKSLQNRRKASHLGEKLTQKLNMLKYEPLWRDLFQRFTASQEAYPSKEEILCPPALLRETRKNIQALLEAQGFTGTYPDFVKHGSIPGIHLAESYGMTYWIGHEKNAVFHIHCEEMSWDNELDITFLCGTALLRPGESAGNIYTCMFNAKGRRIFHAVRYFCNYDTDSQEEPDDLALKAGIAAKRAQLRKLTKQERKADPQVNLLPLFLGILLFGGGFFAAFMTLGMAVICAIATWIFAGLSAIPEILKELPWLQVIVFCWLSFGGVMGILTVLARRK